MAVDRWIARMWLRRPVRHHDLMAGWLHGRIAAAPRSTWTETETALRSEFEHLLRDMRLEYEGGK